MKLNIAIDGPAGSGKSSAGYELAKKLNYQFIDTGLTYRAFTYFCAKAQIDFSNNQQLQVLLTKFNYQVLNNKIYVNNEDVTAILQTSLVLDNINKITGLEFIRTAMVALQRQLVTKKGNVVVGRDITTVVLPYAEIKIYLTASIAARAKRRWSQNNENDITPNNLTEITTKLRERDHVDTSRTVGSLKIAADAIVIDTSSLTFEQTVAAIYQVVMEYKKVGK
ncbi:MAG: (d)CMP kinase [Spiroplasma poulsonii]|uniref:Cytidylate kinase n=1 Tax=Spiroplasma poulsonii TaxID=2138 RepID=A0A2P6FBP2_9MOLU|nr:MULTISPECIES: (d)CMP kinase [Spiroplasma]KAF0851266.1 Cytidylate kinase [Spiroplasma poulsonii]MBH8622842.1 (d)CMP kinase [Spiroplasma sp. hyd1]MBW1241632.1 (d)CMP kinase [Spiroplasma poulsonii]PQM30860.1 Cytidylate kinase [Spiroplasma poulsonii]PWF95853.1 Cytidylate kinase [Spiroplasma poulsonii]